MTNGRRKRAGRAEARPAGEQGLTLIEMAVVLSIIMVIASFAIPAYNRILTRSHEAVLKDDLFTMRKMINEYTLQEHKPPETLEDLVTAGYLPGGLPIDPMTHSSKTWQPEMGVVDISPEETYDGVVNVHSGSNAQSLEGTLYSSW